MIPGVSIVICTYNGAKRLPETLFHIAQQQVNPKVPWEVIIINNGSSDNTYRIIREEWKKYNCPVHFVIKYEPEPGLTAAREAGISIAQYEYIILCDDDNWLSPDYVNIAYEIMSKNDKIGILGGNGELVFEEEPPSWIIENNIFAGGKQSLHSGKVKSNRIYGAGCVLRKSAYLQLKQSNFQFMLSDRRGSLLTSGGDYELCYVLALAQYEIWYDAKLCFRHFITKERMTWEYYLKYIIESSYCYEVLGPYKILLKTRGSNILFWIELGRGFMYFFIRFFPAMLTKIFTSSETEKGKSATLKYLIFKIRVLSYGRFAVVKNNFIKLKQQRLNASSAKFASRQFRLTGTDG